MIFVIIWLYYVVKPPLDLSQELGPPWIRTGFRGFFYVQIMRNLVIFDGSNFYLRAKKLIGRSLGGFDYTKFSKLLTRRGVNEVHYCIGEIRFIPNDAMNLRLYDGQQKLFHNLISHGVTIHRGYLLKNDGVYIEKGVDVRIAIEMLVGALKDRYDRLFLVSSDTDLIPAIQEVRNEKKEVIYVACERSPVSRALRRYAHKTTFITCQMLEACVQ